MPIRRSNHIPFAARTRTVQKRACQNVLNNVGRSTTVLGGKFYGHHYLHGKNGWIDGCFLRRHKPMFYRSCLQTTRYAYKEKVLDIAWDRSYGVSPVEADLSIFDRTVKDPISGLHVTPLRQPHRYPELDGMTRLDWTQAQVPGMANNQEAQVFEHWTFHHDYRSGVGLHATIDDSYWSTQAVNVFIDRFLHSESAMMFTAPLSCLYDQIEHWGIEPSSIAHPWDWDPDFDASVGFLSAKDRTVPRAAEAIEKAVQSGGGIPADEVIAKIEARLEAARAKKWLEA